MFFYKIFDSFDIMINATFNLFDTLSILKRKIFGDSIE